MIELPPGVAAALADARPDDGRRSVTHAAGLDWASLVWGRSDPSGPTVLLVHGVTSSADIWWRVGPALAASGRRVVAVDLPGHGSTGGWSGRPRFTETAADLAAFIVAAGLAEEAYDAVGHSWGAMISAALDPALPAVARPRRRVLVDPPAMTRAEIATLLDDPLEQPFDDRARAIEVIGRERPDWSYGDVVAKAEGLATFDQAAVRSILLDNGDWDGGLAGLDGGAELGRGGAAAQAWIVRGEPDFGSFLPDAAVAALRGHVPPDRVVTIPGAPHSPMRTHPRETVAALLRALG